jgi:SH3-like domain-containing protein
MRIRIVRLRLGLAAISLAVACLTLVLIAAVQIACAPIAQAGTQTSTQTGNQAGTQAGTQAATPPAAAKPVYDPHIGSSTGLPIPRFVSLRADAVNLRVGPGDQYPIQWVYHSVGLPVEVLREFDVWRLVVDADGTEGWMHEATLVDTRHFIIIGHAPVTLFHAPSDQSNPAAQLLPGVIGFIQRCNAGADWCRVRVAHIGGWLERSAFWGTFPGEAIPAK